MALIDEKTMGQIRERFAETLVGQVELRLYRRADSGRLILPGGSGCPTCDAAEELARALAAAAPDKLQLTVIDALQDPTGVEAVPSLSVGQPGEAARITFQGLPAGYEFATLLDAVERTSAGEPGLSMEVAERLAGLEADVEVMVFV
ncbi:MAG TPA: hypothetical protein VIP52_12365, partial [Candidatus Dormibacteraeota bacterium]